MNIIKLWVCNHCGDRYLRTVDDEELEPDLPNHHSIWIAYAAIPDEAEAGPGWFTRYGTPKTTLWEFSIDGLTDERAAELDRRIGAVVEAFQAEQSDGATATNEGGTASE